MKHPGAGLPTQPCMAPAATASGRYPPSARRWLLASGFWPLTIWSRLARRPSKDRRPVANKSAFLFGVATWNLQVENGPKSPHLGHELVG